VPSRRLSPQAAGTSLPTEHVYRPLVRLYRARCSELGHVVHLHHRVLVLNANAGGGVGRRRDGRPLARHDVQCGLIWSTGGCFRCSGHELERGRGASDAASRAGKPAQRLVVRAATHLPAPGRIVPSALCFFLQLLSLFPEIPTDGDERAPAPLQPSGTAAFESCGQFHRASRPRPADRIAAPSGVMWGSLADREREGCQGYTPVVEVLRRKHVAWGTAHTHPVRALHELLGGHGELLTTQFYEFDQVFCPEFNQVISDLSELRVRCSLDRIEFERGGGR